MKNIIQKISIIAMLFFAFANSVFAQSPKFEDGWWMPNGPVQTIAADSIHGKVYIGGSFDMVGPRHPYNILISHSTGKVSKTAAVANDTVFTCIPDGKGGWYLGGKFTRVGDSIRYGIAQVDSGGKVTGFESGKQGVEGVVRCLQIAGKNLYIGGRFINMNGVARKNLASIRLSDAVLRDWAPQTDDIVLCMNTRSDYLYVGGRFSMIDSSNIFRLAALDTFTGKAFSWNPGVNSDVNSIALYDTFVIIGGKFTAVAYKPSGNVAVFSIYRSAKLSYFSNFNYGEVTNLRIFNNKLYVCGGLSGYDLWDSKTTNYYNQKVAVFDLKNWTAIPWKLTTNLYQSASVVDIAKYKNHYYLCGSFTGFNQTSTIYRSRFAVIDSATQATLPIECNISNTVYQVVASNSGVYAVEEFISAEGVTRSNLSRYEINGYVPDNWNPRTDGIVNKILPVGDRIFIGGQFQTLAGVGRSRLGCLNYNTNAVTAFNPVVDYNGVNTLEISKNKLLIGGNFNTVASQDRNGLAITDTALGYCFVKYPKSGNGRINIIKRHGSLIYIGGEFGLMNGENRTRSARVDTANFANDLFKPEINIFTTSFLPMNGYTFMGTSFGNYSTGSEFLFKLDSASGNKLTWNSKFDKGVNDLALLSGGLFAGGIFTHSGNKDRQSIASFRIEPFALLPFNPQPDGQVGVLATYGKRLFVGGYFNRTSNQWQRGFAVYYDTCINYYDTIKITTCKSYSWQSKVYTQSGQYSVNTWNSHGCPLTKTLNLTINVPTSGGVHNLSACNKLTYNKVDYTNSGLYVQKLKNHFGCDSLDSLQITIYNIDRRVITATDSLYAIEQADSFQWLKCDSAYTPISGEKSHAFKPTKAGVYAVAISRYGCTEISDCFSFFPLLSKQITEMPIRIYPNPVSSTLEISSDPIVTIQSADIFDVAGRKIQTYNGWKGNTTLSVADLSPGIYLLEFKTTKRDYKLRFQKI